MPAGRHQVRMEFAYDGVGLGLGGDVVLSVDGEPVGQGRVDGTVPLIYSMDETCDVGHDTASPVTEDYAGDSTFRGRIHWVQIDVDEAAEAEQQITPEERFRIAMARQ
jgi:arylsulfatase